MSAEPVVWTALRAAGRAARQRILDAAGLRAGDAEAQAASIAGPEDTPPLAEVPALAPVVQRLGLSPAAVDLLMAALLDAFEPAVEPDGPSDLRLGPGQAHWLEASPAAPLVRFSLLRVDDTDAPRRAVSIESAVVETILGSPPIGQALAQAMSWTEGRSRLRPEDKSEPLQLADWPEGPQAQRALCADAARWWALTGRTVRSPVTAPEPPLQPLAPWWFHPDQGGRGPRPPAQAARNDLPTPPSALGDPVHPLARRSRRVASLSDLVLPPVSSARLVELATFARHQPRLWSHGGFARTMGRGGGLKALFFGRPGTGKSRAAECVAAEAGLPLLSVDLGAVHSKWIGETEKQISALFDAATSEPAVLFFDEADALFGARTGGGSATERFANLETNHLLQRLESFEGIAILATNLRQNIDDAFFRRFHFSIEFPLPDAAARRTLWQRAFPAETPTNGLDATWLAERFRLSGGSIQQCALRAACFAADKGRAVTMEDVAHALVRELQNLGRDVQERAFGAYWPSVRLIVDAQSSPTSPENPG